MPVKTFLLRLNTRIMNKIEFMQLWDRYNKLLTPTQQDITNLYFNLDLTVSEIAQEKGISRQAVSDCLAGCKKQLEEYEQKLHFVSTVNGLSAKISLLVTGVEEWAEKFVATHPGFSDEVAALTDILDKNYSAEAKSALNKK